MSKEHSHTRERDNVSGADDPERDERLLTDQELAGWLNIKPQTLRSWRVKGIGPPYILVGSAVRYSPSRARKYIKARTRRSTSQGSADAA